VWWLWRPFGRGAERREVIATHTNPTSGGDPYGD
jgi:hypothetical protein